MKRIRLYLAVWMAGFLTPLSGATAQTQPNIGFVYPAGGQRGTVVHVIVGGQHLDGVDAALISGDGLEAEIVEHTKPIPRKTFNDLRQKSRELNQLRLSDEIDRSKMDEEFVAFAKSIGVKDMDLAAYNVLRRRQNDPKRQPNPQLDERVTIRLAIAEDAKLGDRELRLKTPKGLTNPLVIQVGNYPEHNETKPNDERADEPFTEELPVIINGQVLPGDVDRFSIEARKGMHLVASVQARALIPYLADAVPGWFQATLALKDPHGNEVAYSDDHGFDPDPVIGYEILEDGKYTLEIRDAIYRGREDFVYRMTLGEQPFITSIFPLGGLAGETTAIELTGWNLTTKRQVFDAQTLPPGIVMFSVRGHQYESNDLPFELDLLNETREFDPKKESRLPQSVELPIIINGRIDHPDDDDVYQFSGISGQQIVAEVRARRLGSDLDSILKLTDLDGNLLASNDDFVDKGAGLTTHQADSRVSCSLPSDGIYQLRVGDTQRRGGQTFGYRLRLSAPKPDFELRFVPSSINAGTGTNVELTVHAIRQDGFDGPIDLRLTDMPKGFSLSGGLIQAGEEQVQLTMAVPVAPLAEPIPLNIQGAAVIEGEDVVRTAIAADDQMQAFLYRHLVPRQQGMVMITGKSRRPQDIRFINQLPLRLSVDGTARLQLKMPTWKAQDLTLEIKSPPQGLAIGNITYKNEGLLIELTANGKDITPGMRGNLIIEAFRLRTSQSKTGSSRSSVSVGYLPAVPFEISATPVTLRQTTNE